MKGGKTMSLLVERGTVRVKYFAQDHITITSARLEHGPFNSKFNTLTFEEPGFNEKSPWYNNQHSSNE